MGWLKGRSRPESTRFKMQGKRPNSSESLKGNQNARRVGYTPAGMSRHPLAGTYVTMIHRCFSEKSDRFKHYGGRGITVCERWLEEDGKGFLNFLEDMGPRPEGIAEGGRILNYTLERSDNDGNYCPENCRWASYKEQRKNQRVILELPS